MTDLTTHPPKTLFRLFIRFGGWVSMLLFALLLLLTLVSRAELRLAERFDSEGIEATAIVRDKERRETRDSDGDRKVTYYLTLEYQTRTGAMMETRPSVSRSRYAESEIGSSLQIWYLQSAPDRIETVRGSHQRGARAAQIAGLVLGLLALGGLWYSGGRAVAAVRARRYGQREEAVVTGLSKTRYKVNNSYRYRVTWREASGREGQSLAHKLKDINDIAPGTAITVYQGVKKAWWSADIGDRPDP